MDGKINYQLILDKEIENIEKSEQRPSLLLHACCAPCSTYVLEYLMNIFDITLLYYNPNISPIEEYEKRSNELLHLADIINHDTKIKCIVDDYDNESFLNISRNLEHEPEGGKRCELCYRLRLSRTARLAKENRFDYFTTTLSISPHKNAQKLNDIGNELSEKFGIKYLFSDFKKKNGYLKSCQLSEKFNLYRQNYCGCIFSKNNAAII